LGDLWYLNQISDRAMREKLTDLANSESVDKTKSIEVFQVIKEHLLVHGGQQNGQLTCESDQELS